jgi:hypothetical protein
MCAATCSQVKGQDVLYKELARAGVTKTDHVLLLQLCKEQEELYTCYLEASNARSLVFKGAKCCACGRKRWFIINPIRRS